MIDNKYRAVRDHHIETTFLGVGLDQLEEDRYWLGIYARSTSNPFTIERYRAVEEIIGYNTLPQDDGSGFDEGDFASAFMTGDEADAHFERFGRPAFPNEY